jgi:hypothetical protein
LAEGSVALHGLVEQRFVVNTPAEVPVREEPVIDLSPDLTECAQRPIRQS